MSATPPEVTIGMPILLGITALRRELGRWINWVEQGGVIVVTRRGQRIAALIPWSACAKLTSMRRIPSAEAGKGRQVGTVFTVERVAVDDGEPSRQGE